MFFSCYTQLFTTLHAADICQMLASVTTIADICDDVDHLLVRNGHLLGREQESLGVIHTLVYHLVLRSLVLNTEFLNHK